MPPVITTGLHIDRGSGAFVNDYILHCRTRLQRFFYCREQLDFTAPTERTVLGNDDRGLTIVNAINESVSREAAEYDRVRCADTRTSQYGNGQLRCHSHVDGDAIAFLHLQRFQNIGEFLHLAMELLVGEGSQVARFTLPDDRGFIFT